MKAGFFTKSGRHLEAVEEASSSSVSCSTSSSFDDTSASSSGDSMPSREPSPSPSFQNPKTRPPSVAIQILQSSSFRTRSPSSSLAVPPKMPDAIVFDHSDPTETIRKQVFDGVSILDEQLLPDNGIILRTWSSAVAW